jgi:hypothetical protein
MIRTLPNWWYHFQCGVRNLWAYRRIIWGQREWDYSSLLELMEFKMRRMAVAIGDKGHLKHGDRHGRQLRVCADLCRRIHQDDYLDNLTGPTEFRSWSTPTEHGTYRFHLETYRNGVIMTDAEIRRYYKMAERNRKNDLDYLCRVMSKHFLEWWD